jgi:hypothetical protein
MANDDLVQGRGTTSGSDWSNDDAFWRENYSSRPYVQADRGYEHYQSGYRFGHESARRYRGRDFTEAEPTLRREWDSYEHRGSNKSTWDEIKDSVRDAWDRVTGKGGSQEESRRDRPDAERRF